MTRSTVDSLADLKSHLADRAETLLVELFGQPTTRRAHEWRWGSKGSLRYNPRRHTVYSFEMAEGGSLIDAIRIRNGSSFQDAVAWARAWLGDDAATKPKVTRQKQSTFDADADQQRAAAEASMLWRAGRSVNGTAAARYLKSRAISSWPDSAVRFIGAPDVARITAWPWWRWSAVMFPLTHSAGDVTSVQLVALTDQGEAAVDQDGKKMKRTRGPMAGSAVRFPGDAAGPLILAEGPETGLSLWQSSGHETWSIIGAIGRAPLDGVPLSRTILVARDDDGSRAPSRKALREAVARWRREGRHVVEAQPWSLSRGDKSDFNDLLMKDGLDAVRKRIDQALRPQETTQGMARTDALLELSKAIGRTVSELLIGQSDGGTAPFKVVRSTVGLGKSEATLQAIIDAIAAGHRIIYSAPTHELARELATRAEAIAAKRGRRITVRVWHGRERVNPDAPSEKMCLDVEAAKLAQQAGLDVFKTVCDGCQHRTACAYLPQREASADLWFVPHSLLFTGLPTAMKDAALLVIDEGIALAGIVGTEGKPSLVSCASLAVTVTAGNSKAEKSADLNATLHPIRQRLLTALADHPASENGDPLQRASLVAVGLTVDLADAARKAEGGRTRYVDAITAATRGDLLRELRAIKSANAAARRTAMLWRHVADLLSDDAATASGRVDVVTQDDGTPALRLYGLKAMGEGWSALPTLHLDATADMALIRLRVPHAELVASIEAAEPFVTVHQIVGRAFGKMALEHGKAADDARRFGLALASEAGGRWLMVASKDAADSWEATLPAHVGVAHWGGLRGLDQFNDVAGVVCVGRWGVPPNEVGRIAAILTGRAVPRVEGWYPTATMTLTAADGSARTIDADRHPDATAEAVRRALVEAELVQAVGRARGVQRNAGTPLTVYVLGNVPLPLPLATLSDWQAVDPDRAMLADTGAWLESAGDAATITGQTIRAVQGQRARAKERTYLGPNRYLLFGNGYHLSDGLAAATYQRTGLGCAEQRMVYDPRRIPDPQAWLEDHLGPLAYFDAIAAPAPAATPPLPKDADSGLAFERAMVGGPDIPPPLAVASSSISCAVPVHLDPDLMGTVGNLQDMLAEAAEGPVPICLPWAEPPDDPEMDEAVDYLAGVLSRLGGGLTPLPVETLPTF